MWSQFLQAIHESPTDDTPRLLFADWLEERSDPRGDFIRTQCLLARVSVWDPSRRHLHERERQLLRQYRDHWMEPFAGTGIRVGFRRGLLDVYLRQDELLLLVDLVHSPAWVWVGGLCVLDSPPPGSVEWLSLMENYSLYANTFANDWRRSWGDAATHLYAFLTSTALAGLDAVRINYTPLGDALVYTLATSPHGTGLGHVDLQANRITSDGVRVLMTSPNLKSMTHLNLAGNFIDGRGIADLANSAGVSRLQELVLVNTLDRDCFWRDVAGRMTAFQALANSPQLDNLREFYAPTGPTLDVLLPSHHLRRLQVLSFCELSRSSQEIQSALHSHGYLFWDSYHLQGYYGIKPVNLQQREELRELLEAIKIAPSINEKPLRGNVLFRPLDRGELNVTALEENPWTEQVTHLDLTHLDIGATTVCALVTSSSLANLAGLALDAVSDNTLRALTISPYLQNLRRLSLQGYFSDQGISLLTEQAALVHLEELELDSGNISAGGVLTLLESPFLPNLSTLRLGYWCSQINPDEIANSPCLLGLRELAIQRTDVFAFPFECSPYAAHLSLLELWTHEHWHSEPALMYPRFGWRLRMLID
jgi:uncharacterized protein (TIGR02996 family)